jgi:hypothetical protein
MTMQERIKQFIEGAGFTFTKEVIGLPMLKGDPVLCFDKRTGSGMYDIQTIHLSSYLNKKNQEMVELVFSHNIPVEFRNTVNKKLADIISETRKAEVKVSPVFSA